MDWNSLLSNSLTILLITFLLEIVKKIPQWRRDKNAALRGVNLEMRKLDMTEEERLEARQDRQFANLEKELEQGSRQRAEILAKQEINTKTIEELGKKIYSMERSHEREISEINHKLVNEQLIRAQYERDIKFILDEVGIAYWEADAAGNVTATNQTFLDLSGLTPAECRDDGWLAGICEKDREKVRFQWQSFISNTETLRPMTFKFCNKQTGRETDVRALGKALYLERQEIHKYIVRTRTIFRVS